MIEQLQKQLKNPDSLVSLLLGIAVVVVTGVLIFNYVKGKKAEMGKSPTTQEEQTNAAKVTLPTTHVVMTGETLWSIAQKYFDSGYNWVDIAGANSLKNANWIEAGQTLTIPNVPKKLEGQVSSATVEVKMPADNKYTVKHGDTLWSISLGVYGTGFRWSEIAKLNNLAHPNLIHTGNVLMLP